MKTSLPLYCLPPSFSNSPYSFCCLVSLAECLIKPDQCVFSLNDIMDLDLSSLVTLVSWVPCCVLCNKASNLLKVWHPMRWFLLVLWFDIFHIETNTNRDQQTDTCITISTTCQVHVAATYWRSNLLTQKFTLWKPTMSLSFKITH